MSIITISRGTLSGGRAVAECLAAALGYECVGREILQDAARKLGGAAENLFDDIGEQEPDAWQDRRKLQRETYVIAAQVALAERCIKGNIVYHGLAGQFLLRGLPGVLRVRLVAPLEMRIKALMNQQAALTRQAAEEFIADVDEDRRRWAKLMYDVNVEDPSLYDLTVNLRSMSLKTACTIIAEAAKQPQYEMTPQIKHAFETFAVTCHQRLLEVSPGSS